MLSRPTTDQAIEGVIRALDDTVLAAVGEGPAGVAVQMARQILRGCAVRAAHEIAWMHEEIAAICRLAERTDAPAVRVALDALGALDTTSLHLADVQVRYDRAGEVLSCVVDAAFAAADAALTAAAREVLEARSAHEMEIVGQLDLVGRG